MNKATITAYEELPFEPLGEGSPVEGAVLWGNPETGPTAIVIKFPEGYEEPWHSHTTTYQAVIIKGKFQIRSKDAGGSVSNVYGPGAYVVQPGGAIHSEVNAGPGELAAIVYFDGPVDFVFEE